MIRLGNYGTPLEQGETFDFEGEVLIGNLTTMGEFILPLAVELTDDVRCRTPFVYNDTFTPEMTSNTLPSGNVASASNVYTTTYAAWKAFDHLVVNDDAWMTQTGVTTGWVQIQLALGKVARKYTIYDRRYDLNQDAGGASYAPYTWDFQGSNNGSNWTTLDSQDEITWDLDEQEAKTFEFNNAISYTYYRINVSANNGGGRLAIGEIYIYDEMNDPPLQVSALSNISDSILMSFTRASDVLIRSVEEVITFADTLVAEATTTLSDILSIQDLSIPLFIKLNEILTLTQVPFTTTFHTLTEQGYERASTTLTETGDFIYGSISEMGRELLIVAHQHGLQVSVMTRKSDNIRLNDFKNAGFEYVILNILMMSSSCLSNMSFFLNEILQLVEALPIRVKSYRTIEIASLTGMSQFGSMRYILDRIDIIGSKRVYPTTSLLDEIVTNDTYKVVVSLTPLTELIEVIDTVVGSLSRFMIERINIIGTKAIIASRTLTAETINIVDTMYASGTQILSEILTLSDSILRMVTARKEDVVNIERNVITKNVTTNVLLHTITLPDILTRGPSVIFTEIINIIDSSITPLLSKVFTEVVSLVTPLKLRSEVNKVFAEVMNVIDVGIARVTRPLPESIAFTDSLFIPPFTRVLIEILRMIDSPRKLLQTSRTESITLNDTMLPGIINYIFVEILNVSSALNPTSIRAYLSESFNINGVFSRHVNLVGVEILNVIDSINVALRYNLVNEIINIIDTRLALVSKPTVEQIRVGDTRFRSVLTYRSEVINLIDVMYSIFGMVLTELITFTDSIVKRPLPYMIEKLYFLPQLNRHYSQLFTELITISESITNLPSYILLESIEFIDSVTTRLSLIKTEIVNISSARFRAITTFKTEEIIIAGSIYSTFTMLFTELINLSDNLTKSLLISKVEQLLLAGIKRVYATSYKTEIINVVDTITSTFMWVLTEVLNLGLTIIGKPTINKTETVTLTGTKIARPTLYKIESINLYDIVFNVYGILLTEILSLGSTIINNPVVYFREGIILVGRRFAAYEFTLSELINIGDILINAPTLVFTELIHVSDILNTRLSMTKSEVLKLSQIITKRSMKYQDLETVSVSDTYHVSALTILITEALTIVDSTYRSVFRTMNEIVKILDEKCAKRVSFVAYEIIAMIDMRNATLDQSLQEVILVSDSIRPSMMLVRLEALLVSNTVTRYVMKLPFEEVINIEEATVLPTIGRVLAEIISIGGGIGNIIVEHTLDREKIVIYAERIQKTIVYSAFEEILTITSTMGRTIVNVSPFVDSLIISSEMGSTTIVLRAFEEVIALSKTMNKIVHDYQLALESISIADSPKEWYNNIIHRLESVVKQVTKIRTSSRTDKEKSIKKITKDSKRE